MANTTQSQAGKVWFVTGAGAGLGRVLAEHLLAIGAKVVLTSRKTEALEELAKQYAETALLLALDVTSQEQVDAAVAATIARFGRIDVLVNNAGFGIVGAIEECSEQEFRPMFETNVFGLVRVTQAVLPHLRAQKSGHVLMLSSIGGLFATPGFGFYNGTKFAVEGISEALAEELKPLGIHVVIVEPGPFRTRFLDRGEAHAARRIADYDPTAGKMRAYFEGQNGKQVGDPQKAAEAMVAVVESATPPLRLLLGGMTIPRLKGKIASLEKDMKDWEAVTLGADYAG